jgi:hypothetical protein
MFELIKSTSDPLVICISDGFGASAGLLAGFAAACSETPFTLIIHFSIAEVSIFTRDYPHVPSTAEWKEACQLGGHLIQWDDHHVWIKLSSVEMHGIFSKTTQTP